MGPPIHAKFNENNIHFSKFFVNFLFALKLSSIFFYKNQLSTNFEKIILVLFRCCC